MESIAGNAKWWVEQGYGLRQTPEVMALNDEFFAIKARVRAADAALVGAIIAKVFIDNPWLKRFTIKSNPTQEYDDSGGSYRCINADVTDISVVPGLSLPEEFAKDGDSDGSRLEDWLLEQVEEFNGQIYDVLNEEGSYEDQKIELDRAAIQELIAKGDVDGCAAFMGLFPDHVSVVVTEQPA